MLLPKLIKTAFHKDSYYRSMNMALKAIDGNYRMLHYPLYENEQDSFDGAQENLIKHCVNQLSDVSNKKILDIGCGNGVVSLFLAEKCNVGQITGIDIDANNIQIAQKEQTNRGVSNASFEVGDAQNLVKIPDNSVDGVINIESAFHYSDKTAFLNEVARILKPGGEFVIADIVTTHPGNAVLKKWKERMSFKHWRLSDYEKAFKNVNLQLNSQTDISDSIIKAFKRYRHYIKGFGLKRSLKNSLLKLFFVINAKVTIHTLAQKRKYYVFYGQKAA